VLDSKQEALSDIGRERQAVLQREQSTSECECWKGVQCQEKKISVVQWDLAR
jgi:hypothetical protein